MRLTIILFGFVSLAIEFGFYLWGVDIFSSGELFWDTVAASLFFSALIVGWSVWRYGKPVIERK